MDLVSNSLLLSPRLLSKLESLRSVWIMKIETLKRYYFFQDQADDEDNEENKGSQIGTPTAHNISIKLITLLLVNDEHHGPELRAVWHET